MRDTEANACISKAWIVQNSSRAPRRALRLAVVALGIGLVMTAGAARAADDDEDDGAQPDADQRPSPAAGPG